MPKLIKFAQRFPAKHPNEKERTYFVEKMLNTLGVDFKSREYLDKLFYLNRGKIEEGKLTRQMITYFFDQLYDGLKGDKQHTIRAGQRFKPGDMFTPTVWSGRPYNSPQIIFWDDIEVKKTYEVENTPHAIQVHLNHLYTLSLGTEAALKPIAHNDGLTVPQFKAWFAKPMHGQIIAWTEIDYDQEYRHLTTIL